MNPSNSPEFLGGRAAGPPLPPPQQPRARMLAEIRAGRASPAELDRREQEDGNSSAFLASPLSSAPVIVLEGTSLLLSAPSPTLEDILSELMCPVCYEPATPAVTTPCGHTLCDRCLCNWHRVSKSCPTCRKPIHDLTVVIKNRVVDSVLALFGFHPRVSSAAAARGGGGSARAAIVSEDERDRSPSDVRRELMHQIAPNNQHLDYHADRAPLVGFRSAVLREVRDRARAMARINANHNWGRVGAQDPPPPPPVLDLMGSIRAGVVLAQGRRSGGAARAPELDGEVQNAGGVVEESGASAAAAAAAPQPPFHVRSLSYEIRVGAVAAQLRRRSGAGRALSPDAPEAELLMSSNVGGGGASSANAGAAPLASRVLSGNPVMAPSSPVSSFSLSSLLRRSVSASRVPPPHPPPRPPPAAPPPPPAPEWRERRASSASQGLLYPPFFAGGIQQEILDRASAGRAREARASGLVNPEGEVGGTDVL